MAETFGARLRRRREEQQIALATIAERTKIKQSLLEALERDDVSHWPSGIFRRSFVRSYAHAINLDADVVVKQFFEVFPEPHEVVTTEALSAAADAARGAQTPSNRFRSFWGSAVGSLSRRHRVEEPLADVAPNDPPEPMDAPGLPDLDSPDRFLPRGLNRMEKALEAISASARMPTPEPAPDFVAVAELCTRFACAESTEHIRSLLEQAAAILDATGIVVWLWNRECDGLRPVLSHGYSDRVLARLPNVKRDADNLTALAYRSRKTSTIDAPDGTRCAVAIPLVAPMGCAGVLALELNTRQNPLCVAAATIVAAQLSQLLGGGEAQSETTESLTPAESFAAPVLRAGAGA